MASLALVRVALLQVFRRKSYWALIGLGLLNFFMYASIVYGVTQLSLPRRAQQELLDTFGFSPRAEDMMGSGYFEFMQRQSIIVMILLAFSGSLLVGSDFRLGSLPFYLARRIDRSHYIIGKLLAVSAVIAILTVLPALALFVEFGMFTSSVEYWTSNWRVPVAIVIYGGVLCAVLSTLLVALSAHLQRTAPIAITWSSLFMMLATVARHLRRSTDEEAWNLIDPWRAMRYVGQLAFGPQFDSERSHRLALAALALLVVVCGLALLSLARRVRAVDVIRG
jgi:hypothetical protein